MLAGEIYDDLDAAQFTDPAPAFRPQPWWFLNGALEPEVMRAQIAQMHEQGCGGIYLTPRQGMGVPYLSSEYWERFKLAMDEARGRGMLLGIMDDFPYPSGMAGGRATWADPAFIRTELRGLQFEVEGTQALRRLLGTGEVIRAWAWPIVEGATDWSRTVDLRIRIGVSHPRSGLSWMRSLTDYSYARFGDFAPQNELAWDVPRGRWRVMIFTVDRCRSFKYFGEFIDTMSPEAVANFLRITFGEHETGLGRPLGAHFRSVFTDETQGGSWTLALPEAFEERCGYDLHNHLPALIDERFPDAARVRYDYLSTLDDLFMRAYHEQYAAECEARGLLYTTEVPMLRNADLRVAHIPGADHAHERIGEGLAHGWLTHRPTYARGNPRFAASIAAQRGMPRVAVEAFHSLGWGVRLADMKALIDRMSANGVNLLAMHGFYYTAAGLAKHDAAPSEFQQHPWWRHFRALADYAGRLAWIASRGRDVAQIALLDPVTSLWTGGGDWWGLLKRLGAGDDLATRISDDWTALIEALGGHQRPWHHLDPQDLARATVDGDELVVGEARYRALVAPPMANLEADAFARLREFAEAGGIVLCIGLLPIERIEAASDVPEEAARLFGVDANAVADAWFGSPAPTLPEPTGRLRFIGAPGGVRASEADGRLLAALDELLPAEVELATDERWRDHVLAHIRDVEGRRVVLLANCSPEELPATVRLRTDAPSAERWDAETGLRAPLACRRESDLLACDVTLPAHGSVVVVTSDQPPARFPASQRNEVALDLRTPWRIAGTPRNILRMGRFDFALGERVCATDVPPEPIINTLARLSGTEPLPVSIRPNGFGPTAWRMEYPLSATWRAGFIADHVPDDLRLVVDPTALAGDARVALNGTELPLADAQPEFVFEHTNAGWPVAELVRQGDNELLLQLDVHADDGGMLDAAWLVGSFAVAGAADETRQLVAPPENALPLDLPASGLPHFAGTLALERAMALPAADTHLALSPEGDAFLDCAELFVGGRSLGVRCWPPYRWELPEESRGEGSVTVRLEITTSAGPAIEGKAFDMQAGEYVEL